MICSSCGNQCDDNSAFCTNCGAPLSADQANTAAPEAAPEVITPEVEAVETAEAPKSVGTLSIVGLIVGICAVVFTLVGCLCGCCGSLPAGICSLAGIIIAIVGMNKAKKLGIKDTKLTVALILSIVAAVLNVVIGIVFIVVGAGSGLLSGLMSDITGYSSDYYYY